MSEAPVMRGVSEETHAAIEMFAPSFDLNDRGKRRPRASDFSYLIKTPPRLDPFTDAEIEAYMNGKTDVEGNTIEHPRRRGDGGVPGRGDFPGEPERQVGYIHALIRSWMPRQIIGGQFFAAPGDYIASFLPGPDGDLELLRAPRMTPELWSLFDRARSNYEDEVIAFLVEVNGVDPERAGWPRAFKGAYTLRNCPASPWRSLHELTKHTQWRGGLPSLVDVRVLRVGEKPVTIANTTRSTSEHTSEMIQAIREQNAAVLELIKGLAAEKRK